MQRLGELLVRAGMVDQAEPFLQKAIELDEQSKGAGFRDLHRERDRAAAHVNLALVHAARSSFETALENLRAAIEHFDGDANTRAMAGDFAKRLGRNEEAIEHFKKALQLSPSWKQVMSDLKQLEAPDNAQLPAVQPKEQPQP